MAQEILDLFLIDWRFVRGFGVAVRGTDDGVADPREDKNYPSVLGLGDEEPCAWRTEPSVQYDVRAGADLKHRRSFRVIQLSNFIGEWTGGIDHTCRAYLPFPLLGCSSHDYSCNAPVIFDQVDYPGVIYDCRAMLAGGQGDTNVQARVVKLTVVIQQTSKKVVAAEHMQSLDGFSRRKKSTRSEVGIACQCIVYLQTEPIVGDMHGAINRNDQRERPGQVRGVLKNHRPLSHGVPD